MKTGSFIYLSLLGLAAAQPQHGHRHADYHKKRDVVVTDIQTVFETAPAAVVYVDPEGSILYTSTQTPTVAVAETVAAVPTEATVSAEAWSWSSTQSHPHSKPVSKPPPPPETTSSTSSTPAPAPTTSTTPTTTSTPTPTPTTTPTTTAAATTATSLAGGPGGYIGGASSSSSAPASSAPASSNSGYGIAYSPYNNDGSCKTQDEVSSDFEQISDFSIVRSYGVDCNQVTTMMTAAKAKNMQVLLGIFNIQGAQLAADIATLVAAVDGDWSAVHSVSIGNEDVNQGKASVAQVVSATNTGRTLLRAAGFQGDVVHIDTFNQVIENPEICEASDYAAANCHAFFDPNTDAAGAGAFVLKQAQAISKACGGKTTYITESGWPHEGDANGDAVPSPANQATALASLKSSFSSNLFLFSAFDTMWKQNNAGTFGAEQFWGFLS